MTRAVALILAWMTRQGLAFLLIVLILLAGRYALEPVAGWLGSQASAARTLPRQQAAYAEARRGFERYADQRRSEAEARTDRLAGATEAQLRARKDQLGPEIARWNAARLSSAQLALAAARGDSARVLAHYRAGAEVALAERELVVIDAILQARAVQRRSLALSDQRRVAADQLRSSHRQWVSAQNRVARLEGRFLAGPRNRFCQVSPLGVGCENYRALVAARAERDAALARNRQARLRIAAIDKATEGLAAIGAVTENAASVLDQQRDRLVLEAGQLDQRVQHNQLLRIWTPVREVLPAALGILIVAIFSPVLIKSLLFFWVAPAAERRRPVRLLPDDEGRLEQTSASAPSQTVTLHPGEELLVSPEALASTPHHAHKRTRWLLSARMPFSSLASGLFALTSLQLDRRDTVRISATSGPLAEVALLRLEAGSALVLSPRALRGLLHTAGEPVRITRHWRLGPSAWLILQLRYLVLHGPCTLVIEGARGVRLERAGTGRGVERAATLGFSAGLDHAVSRTETFAAFLMGRRALFNDSFRSGSGAYIYEEAASSGVRGGPLTGALRGLGDAALKVVGL